MAPAGRGPRLRRRARAKAPDVADQLTWIGRLRIGVALTQTIIDAEMVRLCQPAPDSLEVPAAVLHTGRFVIFVYADFVATRWDASQVHAPVAVSPTGLAPLGLQPS